MTTKTRKSYVAGKFYPGSQHEIYHSIKKIRELELQKIVKPEPDNKSVIGGIVPHAGQVYCGRHTIHLFENLKAYNPDFDLFLILHPIHRGGNIYYATDENQYWSTPLGNLSLDEDFIDALNIQRSAEIHKWEHSAEVILPFIQYYYDSQKSIVPVGICWQHPDNSREISQKIVQACHETGKKIIVLASSDFSHFLTPEQGSKMDQLAIDQIVDLNPISFFQVIKRNKMSICGFGPIMSLIYYSLEIAEKPAVKVLSRGNSGQVYPSEKVVDYASMLFYYHK